MNYDKVLLQFIGECIEEIEKSVREAIIEEADTAYGCVSTTDGYIELSYTRADEVEAIAYHDNNGDKRSSNFENWLENRLRYCVDWCEQEDAINEREEDEKELHRTLNLMRI